MPPEPFRFAFMTMPHADDAPRLATGRPDKDHQPGIHPPCGDVPQLAIVQAIVDACQMQPGKHIRRAAHIKAALAQDLLTLCGVAGYAHGSTN
jgi:hypothetical protein